MCIKAHKTDWALDQDGNREFNRALTKPMIHIHTKAHETNSSIGSIGNRKI